MQRNGKRWGSRSLKKKPIANKPPNGASASVRSFKPVGLGCAEVCGYVNPLPQPEQHHPSRQRTALPTAHRQPWSQAGHRPLHSTIKSPLHPIRSISRDQPIPTRLIHEHRHPRPPFNWTLHQAPSAPFRTTAGYRDTPPSRHRGTGHHGITTLRRSTLSPSSSLNRAVQVSPPAQQLSPSPPTRPTKLRRSTRALSL
jgi:hypothetical protein